MNPGKECAHLNLHLTKSKMLEKYMTTFDELRGGCSELPFSPWMLFSFFNLGIRVIYALKKSDLEVLKERELFAPLEAVGPVKNCFKM